MSELRVFAEGRSDPEIVLTDAGRIAAHLTAVGVHFERIPLAPADLDWDANQDEVIEVYREPLDELMQRFDFAAIDVVSVWPDHPRRDKMRRRFACEHWHRGEEGRLFVDGGGVFYVRVRGKVLVMRCRRGDFISLPAGTCHWFDIGDPPMFRSIRLFPSADGWDALPTGREKPVCFATL